MELRYTALTCAGHNAEFAAKAKVFTHPDACHPLRRAVLQCYIGESFTKRLFILDRRLNRLFDVDSVVPKGHRQPG